MKFRTKILFALGIIWFLIITPLGAYGFNSRPIYLVAQNDVPTNHWPMDVDYEVGDGWYIGFNLPYGAYISINSIQYSTPTLASAKVASENKSAHDVQQTGELFYVFPNFRFDFNATSNGFAWEIKSPCCYSRGVTFSLGTTYINIFGSQQSKWSDVVYIFNKQVVKLEQYYNMSVTNGILRNISNYEQIYSQTTTSGAGSNQVINSSQLAGIFFIVFVPALAIATVIYSPLKRKLSK